MCLKEVLTVFLLISFLRIGTCCSGRLDSPTMEHDLLTGILEISWSHYGWRPVDPQSSINNDTVCGLIGCNNIRAHSTGETHSRNYYPCSCYSNTSLCPCGSCDYSTATFLHINCTPNFVQISHRFSTTTLAVSVNPSGNRQCWPLHQYTVSCDNPHKEKTLWTSGTATIRNLYPATFYSCTLRRNGINYQTIHFKTEPVQPSAPRNLTSFPYSTHAHLSWVRPEYPNGSVNYEIRCGRHFSRSGHEFTSINVTPLLPHKLYHCYVRAKNNQGLSQERRHSFRTKQSAPSMPPLRLNVSEIRPRQALVMWEPPEQSHRNGVIIYYNILLNDTNGQPVYVSTNTSSTEYNLTFLEPYHNYSISIAAVTVDVGPYTLIYQFQTDEAAPSMPPQQLNISEIGPHQALLMWEPPEQSQHNGMIRYYNILLNDTEGQLVNKSSYLILYNLTSLEPYHNYSVSIAAVTVDVGPYTSTYHFQTDEAAPSVPPGILNIQTFGTSFHLTVKPIPEKNRNGIIKGYRIIAENEDFKREVRNSTTYLMVESLQPSTTYHCKIAAYTSAGEGPFKKLDIVTQPVYIGIYSGIASGIGVTLVMIALAIAVLVVIIIKNKSSHRRLEEIEMKSTDCVKHNEEEEDNISGSSSLVLELPQRRYLDDAEFSKDLVIGVPARREPEADCKPKDESVPQNVIVKSTNNFINEKNFHLFIETGSKPESTTDCKLAVDNNYEPAPKLPHRGYLEDDNINEVPKVPARKYTDDDIRDLAGHSGGQTKDGAVRSRANRRRGMSDTETVYISSETGMGQILRKLKKKPNPPKNGDDDSADDYTPLDFSTLDRKPAEMSGLADTYMCLSKAAPDKAQAKIEAAAHKKPPGHYTPIGPQDSKASIESSYMSMKSAPNSGPGIYSEGSKNDDDDDNPYMPLTVSTMTRKTAELAHSMGLKNMADKFEMTESDNNSEYMSLHTK